jgi:hypothetical protein
VPTVTQKLYVGDLVMNEYHESYNFEAIGLASATLVPVNADVLGYPVVVAGTTATIQTAALVTAFTGTSVCNIVADDTPVPVAFTTVTAYKYRILRRGPAVVHRQAMKTTDPAAAAYDMAKFTTALINAGIVVVNEVGLTNNA